ncbi:uncharacterized protein RAG0_14888 [Rhynchosporium agropyri]|uniref:Uncharacterized protein n=1 Tax=Rhynchosporium agropyri TaxID=914238 RepID=A0A1E1LIT2_9HELO|nr:uncharacterized protein RAG0_14888 [Rhynchosporium agropyri]
MDDRPEYLKKKRLADLLHAGAISKVYPWNPAYIVEKRRSSEVLYDIPFDRDVELDTSHAPRGLQIQGQNAGVRPALPAYAELKRWQCGGAR